MVKFINRQIIADLLCHPTTMIPMAGGGTWFFSSLIFSLGGSFWGLAAVMVGGAVGVSRYILSYEDLAQKVLTDAQAAEVTKREKMLNALYNKLCNTKEARDENALARLRVVYRTFVEDIAKGKYTKVVNGTTMKQIEDMFNTCVSLLENSYDLWEDASQAANGVKKKIRADRLIVLDRVDEAIEQFNTLVADIRSTHITGSAEKLKRVSRQLQDNLEIAQEVNEEMQKIQDQMNGLVRE